MSLEFNTLFSQIQKMGAMIQEVDFDLAEKVDLALERFQAAGDLDKVYQYINFVRQSDISGYRGAAPLDAPMGKPVNLIHPPPAPESLPDKATIIAADGSQIYPDEQSAVHYYLLNTGLFIYQHGTEHLPQGISLPRMFYHKTYVHDQDARVISNRTVDARRTVQEMKHLAEYTWELKREGYDQPIISLYDNHLLFWANKDVTDSEEVVRDYHGALTSLHDTGAILAGYVDHPYRGRVIMRLLYLLSLSGESEIKMRQNELATGGDLEGLRDINLMQAVLRPGERTTVMVQNSPRNLSYRKRGLSYEIAFFYLKTFNGNQTSIARVDIPMWVARDEKLVNTLHGLLLAQCQMQGRTPYPYALIRADEQAVITNKDKAKLNEMINIELRKRGLSPYASTSKDASKSAARSEKRAYELRTDLR